MSGPAPFRGALISRPGPQLAACAFAILVLELSLIRWIGTQIRIAAYFANLILIAAFLGMGMGVALGRRQPELMGWIFPSLAVLVGVLSLAEPLGFVSLPFPDTSISLWGADTPRETAPFVTATLAVLGCFWAVAGVFLAAGVPVGWLFGCMPGVVAYRWDLIGSLLGVIAMSAMAWLSAPPQLWFALGLAPLLLLYRSLAAAALAGVVVAAAWWSVGEARYSPYNRIDIRLWSHGGAVDGKEWELWVNRDFHQYMHDLRQRPSEPGAAGEQQDLLRAVYELPFRVTDRKQRALIVGAGTGNDAAAALRAGFEEILSVDIDPKIIELGRMLHPEEPYRNPRVVPVVNDARAYFEQSAPGKFDVVSYGLLDSHAMFSAMSSLRLDNYVYTREGLVAGWRHVREDGVLSVSFSVFAGEWMRQRIYRTLKEATGIKPILVPHNYNFSDTYLVGRHLTPERVARAFPNVVTGFREDPSVRIPTDDWPFLYLRPATAPVAYIVVLALLLTTSIFAVRAVFLAGGAGEARFDVQLFLLGAGFMLLETRMVTALSLLFGSTWIVNASVFGGVLAMVLIGNEIAARFRPKRITRWFLPLIASLAGIWLASAGALNQLPLLERALAAGLLYSLPVLFAGVIFSSLLSVRANTSVALGSNLCGAVVGGLLEYLSMIVGMKAIALLAMAIYLAAMLASDRR